MLLTCRHRDIELYKIATLLVVIEHIHTKVLDGMIAEEEKFMA